MILPVVTGWQLWFRYRKWDLKVGTSGKFRYRKWDIKIEKYGKSW